MAPIIDHATLIILDIGENTSVAANKNEKPFFENARLCAMRIIERNIMLQSKNFVGVILLGSSKTKNALADQCSGSFKNIQITSRLQAPSWNMLRDLPETHTISRGDWFEALVVAADHFENGISGYRVNSKKIVLISNLESPANIGKKFNEVVKGFQESSFEVYVIGPDLEKEDNTDIKLVKQFIYSTGGDTATFEEAISGWLFYKKKAAKVTAQNFELSFGPDVKIPISAYIRLRDEPVVKNWQKAVKDPVTSTVSNNEYVMREKKLINIENQAEIQKNNTIEGYIYGRKIIPFSDSDKTMLYQSGEKSLSVYGFTYANNIGWQNLHGDGTYYVFGRKGDKKAQYAINCLVHCLHEMKLVGIVRKIHIKNTEPKMFVLMPVLDSNNLICLSMIGIPYKDNIKYMAFPQTDLKKFTCSKEQVNAFKDLILAMDLTKAYDETYSDIEAFPIAETVSPSVQYILDCIAFRAMNPGQPLPQPRDEIITLFKVPSLIEKKSKEPIEKLKKKFKLTIIEKKNRKRGPSLTDATQNIQFGDQNTSVDNEILKVQLPTISSGDDETSAIGTMDPIKDFDTLKEKGKTLADLVPEMTEAIETLVYTSFAGDFSKALLTMKKFREESVNNEPSHYNNWLQKFKKDLTERKKENFLQIIAEKPLNFILKEENNLSTYTKADSHDESQLYENDTIPNSTELSIRSEVNDLFDEM